MGNLCRHFSGHQINSHLNIFCTMMWVNLHFIQAAWKISQALKRDGKTNNHINDNVLDVCDADEF